MLEVTIPLVLFVILLFIRRKQPAKPVTLSKYTTSNLVHVVLCTPHAQ